MAEAPDRVENRANMGPGRVNLARPPGISLFLEAASYERARLAWELAEQPLSWVEMWVWRD